MIDAVLGTGFNGVLQGVQQRVCGLMNSIAVPVVSIDVPSGVSADTGSADKMLCRQILQLLWHLPNQVCFCIRQLN